MKPFHHGYNCYKTIIPCGEWLLEHVSQSYFCYIKFSFVQTNEKKERRFNNTEYIQTLYNYISQEFELKQFKLLLRYPKKDLITEKSKTLQELNLNNCIIIVDTNI